MTQFGLSEKTIGTIRQIFSQYPQIEKAVLYGSRAKGNYKKGSDIDLTLMGEGLDYKLLLKATEALAESPIAYTVDLSIFDELDHAKLREHIERVGVVFYERGSQKGTRKSGWTIKRLGDAAEVIVGQSPEGKFYNESGQGLPFYQGKKDFGDRYISPPTKWTTQITKEAYANDILMSVRAPVGPINYATEKSCIGRGLAAIRCGDGINHDFLFYFLLSKQDEIVGKEGAVFASISKSEIEAISVPVPPVKEQQRIVAILDEAFEGIAIAKANAEKNLQNAREVFESYLNAIFAKEGDGWIKKKLGDKDLLHIIDGDRGINYPQKSDFSNDGYCLFLNTKNVRPDGFNFDNTMFISEEKDRQLRKGKLKRRDIVLTTRGTIGNIALYDDSVEHDHVRLNSGMLIFRPNENVILSEFLFEIFRSSIMKLQMDKFVTGAAQPQLPIKTLIEFTIPVPVKLDDQKRIVSNLHDLSLETCQLEALYERKIAALDDLKKSLLHQAFNGELKEA